MKTLESAMIVSGSFDGKRDSKSHLLRKSSDDWGNRLESTLRRRLIQGMYGLGIFFHDWTLKGSSCRILSVVDEYTRQAHCLHVARHIGSKTVQALMEQMISEHGAPAFIRSDNGPEFIGRTLGNWLKKQNIKTLYIAPGSPWQNGYVESFHEKFRREFLGRERLNAEWSWMIGNGSITRSDHIEVSGYKAH